MPASSSRNRMPSVEMPLSIVVASPLLGNRNASPPGHRLPSTVGPRMMPARICPMIEGWPIRYMTSPRNRPPITRITTCARSSASAPPPEPLPAVALPSAACARPAQSQLAAASRLADPNLIALSLNSALTAPSGRRLPSLPNRLWFRPRAGGKICMDAEPFPAAPTHWHMDAKAPDLPEISAPRLPSSPNEVTTALVHYYRAEIARMSGWRDRLDRTSNWAITVVAALLSVSLSTPSAHHGVLLFAVLLVALLLYVEARR